MSGINTLDEKGIRALEIRWNYGINRMHDLGEIAKFTMAILFGTLTLMAFASEDVISGSLGYALTAVILSATVFGIVSLDAAIKDIQAVVADAPPEEVQSKIGQENENSPMNLFRLLSLLFYGAMCITQLMFIYG